MHQEQENLFTHFSQSDPKQLKQVIEALIAKSRFLIQNLEDTWEKLEQTESEKTFWKESYFNLRQACQHYVDCNGLTPFTYIASLEDELKKEKVYKSCLQQKFKVMHPKLATVRQKQRQKEPIHTPPDTKQLDLSEQKPDLNRSNSSTLILRESQGDVRFQNKHKIGPKNIQFFKFRQHKGQQQP